jgi:hypothetical protein
MPKDQELDFLLARLKNQTGAAEGSNFPPRLIGGRRVPLVTGLKTIRAHSFSGGTEFVISWLDVELPNVNGYNVYVTGLLSDNKQPALVGLFKRSPAQFRVESNIATQVTFTVQTVLNNGMVSELSQSPSCTGLTISPTISVSDLGPGTPGQLITWDATGTPTTIGPGTTDHILVGSGAGAVPQFKSRATLDLIEGRSTVTALGQILVGSAASGVAKTIAAGAADSILVGSGAGADPQFKTRATLDLVEGRANLTTANRVVKVNSAGVVTQAAFADTDVVTGAPNLTDAGAIPFVVSAGVLSDDPTNLFWDDTNNRLGIGTNAPADGIHVVTPSAGLAAVTGDNYAAAPRYYLRRANGSVGAPSALNSADIMFNFTGWGHDGSAFGAGPNLRGVATENWSGSAHGCYVELWNVDNASTTQKPRLRISADGKVRIYDNIVSNPSARFEVQELTLGSEVFRLASDATNDDPRWSVYQNRLATTDATVTTIHTIAIPASTTVALIAHVNARRTGGAAGTAEDGAFYIRAATFKNVAGTATQIGATTAIHTNEDQAGWDVTFAVAGGNALVQVTGAVDNNITWHLFKLDYSPVGS